MSIQITVNPTGMTKEEREAVAGFILAYPINGIALHPELAQLARELAQFEAELKAPAVASVELDAAIAFGSAAIPLPPPASDATYIVAVALPPIVPEAPPVTLTESTAPVPPAPNAAPIPPAPIAAPQTANPVPLDKDGLPWDSRIHAGSKATIANGTWRKKPSVDPALIATVEAELRLLMAAPAPPVENEMGDVHCTAHTTYDPSSAVPPPPPAPSVMDNLAADIRRATNGPLPLPTENATDDARGAFVKLIGRTAAAIQAGKIKQDEVDACCIAAGVPKLPLLANRLDLVATVAASIDALITAAP